MITYNFEVFEKPFAQNVTNLDNLATSNLFFLHEFGRSECFGNKVIETCNWTTAESLQNKETPPDMDDVIL